MTTDIDIFIEEIQTLEARITSKEALVTPTPTKQSQLIVRHLHSAREYLASAKASLRLARTEITRGSKSGPAV